ncbi:MAG TPA: RHS repeat-associated core domain-containing protein [Chitinophagaceae bacterium]|jgi:RHS repeat-associated protein|nr:RHS repeat-associated core domain-containing protein [Chitinophagaceae bacterium]
MRQHTASGAWSNSNIITAYRESIAYDANGNILKYLRNGTATTTDMDSLNYKYNRDVSGNLVNNKLNYVKDQISSANYAVDIDNQSANNYVYDLIGNLKKDVAEGIDTIRWTVYGKINKIVKNSNSTKINYGYDAGGNRTTKIVSGAADTTTFYVRDAQGNVLAIYTKQNTNALKWDEQDLYGSSRLGIWNWDTIVSAAPPVVTSNPIYDSLLLGSRTYELNNHLGNVLATISDKKIGNDSSGVVNYYLAEVLSQNDYYPFGMLQPGRKYNAGVGYRYGFNGKENDNEVKGEGNQQDYGMRIYDPRLGKFLSADPISRNYPMLTPYQFGSNNPISGTDLDGLEYIHFVVLLDKNGSYLKKYLVEDFRNRSEKEMNSIHKTANFYTQYSAGFGPLGRCVQYTYFQQNNEGKYELLKTDKTTEVDQNSFESKQTRHGLYYGEGSITKKGPYFDIKRGVTGQYDFGYKPIDMVDALGKEHDMEEDKTSFKGWQHPQNIFADIRFVKGLTKYLKLAKSDDFIDPFTGRKPSEEAVKAARNAKILFTLEIEIKKAKLLEMFKHGKISSKVLTIIEKQIEKVEKENVLLPTPKKTDK